MVHKDLATISTQNYGSTPDTECDREKNTYVRKAKWLILVVVGLMLTSLFVGVLAFGIHKTHEHADMAPKALASGSGIKLTYDKYLLVQERKTWVQARYDCKKRGLRLAAVRSPKEQQMVVEVCKQVGPCVGDLCKWCWIGGFDGNGVGNTDRKGWIWLDGSKTGQSNPMFWGPGQPDSTGGFNTDQVCMHLWFQKGYTWGDFGCQTRLAYVCEKVPPKPKPTGKMYKCCPVDNFASGSWQKARQSCQAGNDDLVRIFDAHSNWLALNACNANECWIGLKKDATGKLKWVNGASMSFSSFGPGEPKAQSGECVLMNSQGQWKMAPCTDVLPAVCEYNDDAEV